MVKISVIVPFYKVEKFFAKCLESLVNQTFKDIEIILVDDCGNDSSIDIALEFAEKDNRIKLIKNELNRGQGYSRNAGLKFAQGSYISFVDSDDWLDCEYLEKLLYFAEKNDSDIIRSNMKYVYQDGIAYSNLLEIYDKKYENCSALLNPINILAKQMVSAVCGIYKKDFLLKNNFYFQEDVVAEDKLFCWQTYLNTNKILFVPDVSYYYNQMNSNQSTKNYKIIYDSFFTNNLQIKNILPSDVNIKAAYILYVYFHLRWLLNHTPLKAERRKVKLFFRNCICKDISREIFKVFEENLSNMQIAQISYAYDYGRIVSSIRALFYTSFYYFKQEVL